MRAKGLETEGVGHKTWGSGHSPDALKAGLFKVMGGVFVAGSLDFSADVTEALASSLVPATKLTSTIEAISEGGLGINSSGVKLKFVAQLLLFQGTVHPLFVAILAHKNAHGLKIF